MDAFGWFLVAGIAILGIGIKWALYEWKFHRTLRNTHPDNYKHPWLRR